jgi:KDO2-lipid IV(A) lauroyltransferase
LKQRTTIQNWLEYLSVSAMLAVVLVLPTRMVTSGLRGLSRFAFLVLRKRRDAALMNVERTLGHAKDSPEARRLVRASFQLMVLNFVEPLLADRAIRRGATIDDLVSVDGKEHLDAAFASDRPVLLCTGHFGSWEMMAVYLMHCYEPAWSLARDLNNPLLQRGLLARRMRHLRGNISKSEGGIKLARVMRRGEALGLLLDQNAGRKGVILPFLGLPSSHHTSAGTLGRLFGAISVPIYMVRVPGEFRFHLTVEAPIEVDRSLPDEEAEIDVTRRLSESLEEQVRKAPEQWLWIHDRWRHALRVLERDEQGETPTEHSGVPAAQGTNGA